MRTPNPPPRPTPTTLRFRAREHELGAEAALEAEDFPRWQERRSLAHLERRVASDMEQERRSP